MVIEDSGESDEAISCVVIIWLLLVTLSFLLGFSSFAFLPGAASTTWNAGILTNLGMAVTVGAILGWRRQWLQVFVAVTFGTVVTILGLDLLLFAPTPIENAHWGLLGIGLFDSVAVIFALIGMAILVGADASPERSPMSRCRCSAILRSKLQWGHGSEPFGYSPMRRVLLPAR